MKTRNRHKPSLKRSPVIDLYNIIGNFGENEVKKIPVDILGTAYARCILYEKIYGRGAIDWKSLNTKLMGFFTSRGLEKIKKEAWKILEEEARKAKEKANE